mgnify:CR=1 FL=1
MKLSKELIQELNIKYCGSASNEQFAQRIQNHSFKYINWVKYDDLPRKWEGYLSQYNYFTSEDLRPLRLVCFLFIIGKTKHIHVLSEEFINNVEYIKKLFTSFEDLL